MTAVSSALVSSIVMIHMKKSELSSHTDDSPQRIIIVWWRESNSTPLVSYRKWVIAQRVNPNRGKAIVFIVILIWNENVRSCANVNPISVRRPLLNLQDHQAKRIIFNANQHVTVALRTRAHTRLRFKGVYLRSVGSAKGMVIWTSRLYASKLAPK